MGSYQVNHQTIELIHGDAARVLPTLEHRFGAVITDPPYASGARTLEGKQQGTARKYTATKGACPIPDFEGDALDQRSWTRWLATVLRDARALALPGAPLCAFIDWRQLPALTDAMQWAGWCWRGVAVWDKVNSRPQRGRFRQQAEFVAWGSNGAMPFDRGVGVIPGVLTYTSETMANRYHQTQKPIELMRQIVRICAPGGTILDPFAGYDSVGLEVSAQCYERAAERLERAERGDII